MGLLGSPKQQVRDYMMSVHVGVASTVDAITGIYVDNKTAWEGEITTNGIISIDKHDLFGGVKEQGGLRGLAYALFGRRDQVLDAPLISRLKRTVANCPGYRGLTSVFFTGLNSLPGVVSGGAKDGSGYGSGFWWSSNNPQVASALDVRVRCCPTSLSANLARVPPSLDNGFTAAIGADIATTAQHLVSAINGASQFFTASLSGSDVIITTKRSDNAWDVDASGGVVGGTTYYTISTFTLSGGTYSSTFHFNVNPVTGLTFVIGPETFTFATGADDANPAHMIYDIFTDDDGGMGYTSDLIDTDSFLYAAEVLFGESLGLSMQWTTQTTIEEFVNDILSQIQGLIFVSRSTGLLTLRLIRADYNIADLPRYTVDNAVMSNYQKRALTETSNEIIVTWTNPVNEQNESVYAHDLGNIAAQGGIVSDSRNFYGARSATLAAKLAQREVRSASAIIRSMDMEVDRSAWAAEPGDIVVVDWPENRVSGAVMRVGQIDYGKIDDGMIKVTLAEDIFSLAKPIIVTGIGAISATPSSAAVDVPNVQVFTLPAFYTLSGALQTNPIELNYPDVLAAVFAGTNDTTVFDCELFTQVGSAWVDVGKKSVVESSLLTIALVAAATSTVPSAIFANVDRQPAAGDLVMLGTDDAHQEWCEVTANDGTTISLARGCLDTTPQAWPLGTRIWVAPAGGNVVDTVDVWPAGNSPTYKVLPRTAQGILPFASATSHSGTMTARPHLPLRPANVQINGVGFGPVSVSSATNIAITWATRNRLMEDGLVETWTDASVAPEYQQETVVTVTDDASHAVVYEQGALWTDTSLTLPKLDFAKYASVTIKVWSRKGTLASLQGHSIQVTGLANNPAAALPPAPPTVTDPTSSIAAPGNSAWTVTGGVVSGAGGDTTPAITITGTSDNVDAKSLLIRYRVHGTTAWTDYPAVSITGTIAVTVTITGLAANTQYDVQLAYLVQVVDVTGTYLIPSAWLTPSTSPVTTGASASIAPYYSFAFFFTTAPSTSEVLCLHVAPVAFTIPANFASPVSKGNAGTNPAASFAIDVQKNGTSIGTITISTGGVFTFVTASGTAKSIAIGDVLKFVAPSSADASIANAAITIQGSR